MELSKFISLRARMSEEFDSRKDSHSTKFEWRPWILVKLSFRGLCDSKLSGLRPFDNMAISRVKNRSVNPWSNCCALIENSSAIRHGRVLGNIHTTGNRHGETLPCTLALHFYLLMEKPLGRFFQVRSPYYQITQWNQKTPIPVPSRW